MNLASRAALQLLKIPAAITAVALAGACVIQSPAVHAIDAPGLQQIVNSPVKAHLKDGATVVFSKGVSRNGDIINGYGLRYDIGSSAPVVVSRILVDSVVGMETYDANVNKTASVFFSVVGVTAGAAVAFVGAVALLGSCPTFYADSAGTELLQAEGFSYSIAPLLEQRDVDRLRLTPTADGRVVIHVRNEMLETHYINSLELIEARHAINEEVIPDQAGKILAIGGQRLPASADDRSGRDVSQATSAVDGNLFSTADARLASVTANSLDDYIDVAFAPPSADSAAVVLDMRNSLLNTVLLYDHILGAPGLKSLDYLAKDLEQISTAVDVGRWYAANMGMRVSVLDGNGYRLVTRIGDSGPIAFHRSAVLVPTIRSTDGLVHIRLSFTADNWRIDQIGIADSWRRPTVRTIPVSAVTVTNPEQTKSTLAAISSPDESYVITSPSEHFNAEFEVGPGDNTTRTWFLASQGYYTEWVRGDWIKHATGKPFTPTTDVLLAAIRGWRAKHGVMELNFYNQRISAR